MSGWFISTPPICISKNYKVYTVKSTKQYIVYLLYCREISNRWLVFKLNQRWKGNLSAVLLKTKPMKLYIAALPPKNKEEDVQWIANEKKEIPLVEILKPIHNNSHKLNTFEYQKEENTFGNLWQTKIIFLLSTQS